MPGCREPQETEFFASAKKLHPIKSCVEFSMDPIWEAVEPIKPVKFNTLWKIHATACLNLSDLKSKYNRG